MTRERYQQMARGARIGLFVGITMFIRDRMNETPPPKLDFESSTRAVAAAREKMDADIRGELSKRAMAATFGAATTRPAIPLHR